MKKRVAILSAMAFAAAYAADWLYEWREGETPASILDGKMTFTYDAEDKILSIKASPPEGDRIVFTGDQMTFHDADGNGCFITNTAPCTVVFKNDLQVRTLRLRAATPAAHVWRGTNELTGGQATFLGPDWTVVARNHRLDDLAFASVKQEGDSSATPNWANRTWTMKPYNVVRSSGVVYLTYQSSLLTRSSTDQQYVAVVKAEARQMGDDVCMRALGAFEVVSSADSPIAAGFNIDTLWPRTAIVTMPLRTTGNPNNGYGIATVGFAPASPSLVCRFEGAIHVKGLLLPSTGTRFEIVAPKLTTNNNFQPESGGTIAFVDSSAAITKTSTGSSTSGFLFANTAAAEGNGANEISVTGDWNYTGSFTVQGLDEAPMTLVVKDNRATPSNNTVTVKRGGIVRLSSTGNDGKGAHSGATAFLVEEGGRLVSEKIRQIGPLTKVTVCGGTLVVCAGIAGETNSSDSDTGTDLCDLTLLDGACVLDGGTRTSHRMGSRRPGSPGLVWHVGGCRPSTNHVAVQSQVVNAGQIGTNMFNVARTGDWDADFVYATNMVCYTGTAPYSSNVLHKVGNGTMLLTGTYNINGGILIEEGVFKLGRSDSINYYAYGNTEHVRPPLILKGGSLAVAANTANTFDSLHLESDSGLILERGATLAFDDLAAVVWNPDAELAVTLPVGENGEVFATLKVGTSAASLTAAQLAAIRINGKKAIIDGTGRLRPRFIGIMFSIR